MNIKTLLMVALCTLATACAPFTPQEQAEHAAILKYRASLPKSCQQPEAKCDMFPPSGGTVRITDMPAVEKR